MSNGHRRFGGLLGAGGFEIDPEGIDDVLDLLRALDRKGHNLLPAYQIIDKSLDLFFRRQFQTSGKIGGEPWPPLKQSTVRSRQRSGGNRGGVDHPLWDTSRLRDAWVSGKGEGFTVFQPLLYERGVSVPYARKHQKGDPSRNLPARKQIPDRMPRFIISSWEGTVRRYFERRGGTFG